MKQNTSDTAARSEACSGASDSEQLPCTTVVTPCKRHRVGGRVPPQHRIEVRVGVDEPRRHRRAGGVELRLTVGTQVRPDLDDHAVAHSYVAALRGRTRAVDDRAAAHQ